MRAWKLKAIACACISVFFLPMLTACSNSTGSEGDKKNAADLIFHQKDARWDYHVEEYDYYTSLTDIENGIWSDTLNLYFNTTSVTNESNVTVSNVMIMEEGSESLMVVADSYEAHYWYYDTPNQIQFKKDLDVNSSYSLSEYTSMTYEGIVDVEVPAGTFQAHKYSSSTKDLNHSENYELINEWYLAENIGMVQLILIEINEDDPTLAHATKIFLRSYTF